jgi:hypothetical protein
MLQSMSSVVAAAAPNQLLKAETAGRSDGPAPGESPASTRQVPGKDLARTRRVPVKAIPTGPSGIVHGPSHGRHAQAGPAPRIEPA